IASATAAAMVAEAFDGTGAAEADVEVEDELRAADRETPDLVAAEVEAAELGAAQIAALELEDAEREDRALADTAAEAPGCNVAALAAHAMVEATAGAARPLRRFVPFT